MFTVVSLPRTLQDLPAPRVPLEWVFTVLGALCASGPLEALPQEDLPEERVGNSDEVAPPLPGSFSEPGDLRAACRLKPWRTLGASGYDRGGGFYDSGNFIRVEAERNYVLLDTEGPGCIDRIWCTRKTEKEPYELRVTLDGSSTPDIRIDLDLLFSGKRPPFVPPFAGSVDKARYSYVPVAYQESCRVVLVPTAPDSQYQWRTNSAGEKIPHVYYQISYRTFPKGTPVRPFSWELDLPERRAMNRTAALWREAGTSPWGALPRMRTHRTRWELEPGQRRAVLEATGPGVVYGLHVDAAPTAKLDLELRWDGNESPAAAVPLSILCASPEGAEVRGLWAGRRSGRYYLYFPMPFATAASLHLVSRGSEPAAVAAEVLWRSEAVGPSDCRFHAERYVARSPTEGRDYVPLEVTGRGHFVGIVMDRPGNMEGDDRFFVDGEATPSIHGTGTEDFFNFAWGFGHLGTFALHGITRQGGVPVCYRVHLPAGVPFRKSLRLSWEHGSGNTDGGTYAGCVWYYLLPTRGS